MAYIKVTKEDLKTAQSKGCDSRLFYSKPVYWALCYLYNHVDIAWLEVTNQSNETAIVANPFDSEGRIVGDVVYGIFFDQNPYLLELEIEENFPLNSGIQLKPFWS